MIFPTALTHLARTFHPTVSLLSIRAFSLGCALMIFSCPLPAEETAQNKPSSQGILNSLESAESPSKQANGEAEEEQHHVGVQPGNRAGIDGNAVGSHGVSRVWPAAGHHRA